MGIRKTTTLEVDGQAVEVAMNEIIPGRWSWTVKIDGQHLCSSSSPEVTFHAAYFAALSNLRRQYPHRARALEPGAPPPPGGAQGLDRHPR